MERYFEWDDKKAEVNFRKHGIRFEEAALVFDDPFAISVQDRIEKGEQRWQTIGMAGGFLMLLRLCGLLVPVERTEKKGKIMSMVRYKQSELPALTEERKAELNALAGRPDSEIDYSDIPPLDEAFWARALPNPFFKPVKTHASVRIDSDVLAWLKSQGKGYQTRINAILREAMLKSQRSR
jgi:uncharacterized protein (DUF4415 family)